MKKTLCIILAFLMLLSYGAMAEESIALTADYEYKSEENGYIVFGETNDTKSGDKITVEAILDGVTIDTVVTETISESGKMKFTTEIIPIDASKPTGEINFKVYSAHSGNIVTLDKDEIYYGVGDLFNILKTIETAITNQDYTTFKNTVKPNMDKLGVAGNLLDGFTGDAEAAAKAAAFAIALDLPANVTDVGNSEKVLNQVIYFRNQYLNVTLAGEFGATKSSGELGLWYTKYKEVLSLEVYNKVLHDTYFKNSYTTAEYFTILSGESKAISDATKIKDRLLETGALCYVKNGNANSVQKVFTDFSGKIPTTATASDPYSVYNSLATQTFTSFAKLGQKYSELAGSGGGTNGGGTIVGGNTGGFKPSNNSITMTPPDSNTVIKPTAPTDTLFFKDISNVMWAYDAISELHKRGIINGRSKDEFAPNDSITRAEFVKIIVAAKGMKPDNSQQIFPDVNKGEWYFDYVNSAYKLGLVTGDEMGNFNPNAKITRQDMAVMLYRLIGNNAQSGDISVFTDSSSVSDYAVTAVAYLNNEGVINGMGDGTFAPKFNATRAQAAQMIYRVLSLI